MPPPPLRHARPGAVCGARAYGMTRGGVTCGARSRRGRREGGGRGRGGIGCLAPPSAGQFPVEPCMLASCTFAVCLHVVVRAIGARLTDLLAVVLHALKTNRVDDRYWLKLYVADAPDTAWVEHPMSPMYAIYAPLRQSLRLTCRE